jgi:hypothetical protein
MVMALVGFQNNQPIIAKGVTQTENVADCRCIGVLID